MSDMVAFHPSKPVLATASGARVELWDINAASQILSLRSPSTALDSIAFDPRTGLLASGGRDAIVLWDIEHGNIVRNIPTRADNLSYRIVAAMEFHPDTPVLAAAGAPGVITLWNTLTGELLGTLVGHQQDVQSLAFAGTLLVSGASDKTIKVWSWKSGKLLRTLEGHTDVVRWVGFNSDRRLLCSRSWDHTIRLWDCKTWEPVATLNCITLSGITGSPFHPTLPLLAVTGSPEAARTVDTEQEIHIYEVNVDLLLARHSDGYTARAVHHTTAKIVLVGDHSVGKSALGYRLINGDFKEQASTHGQQFWVFPELGQRREDGTECEAILWDLAGQPDYRLVHALFLDDADLALVLFDASDIRDPLHGVAFWLKQLQRGQTRCPVVLVAAQADRGTSVLTTADIEEFARQSNIQSYLRTSALTGEGINELVSVMKSLVRWEEKPATITTATFKRIKDYLLELKEVKTGREAVVSPAALRGRLQATDASWNFTDAEMLTAVGHLENYGYVKRLRTSKGELRILLAPELINNLASSFVLEARRNPRGLGSLEEGRLLAGGYHFPELEAVSTIERQILIDSAAVMFLEHNICFRETDPLNGQSYLVFPELINLRKPLAADEPSVEEGPAYTVSGAVENVYASLVVLLGYTNTFARTNQWQNHTRYEVGNGLYCGFRQDAERDGELDFVLYFGVQVGLPIGGLFRSLFESFLARRNLTVVRYDPVQCANGHALNRNVVREYLRNGREHTFCNECGQKISLPKSGEAIQLTKGDQKQVEEQRRTAEERTKFEQAVFRIHLFVKEQRIRPPECFISYAWGVPEQERWVERSLATDLQKAGITVVLDRWENARVGSSVPRFVERIARCDNVLVVGTPLYRRKYDNGDPMRGFVVSAEGDLIGKRMIGTEAEKGSVLPLLLMGTAEESFPALLQGRVYADFTRSEGYFLTALDLILSLYKIPPHHEAVADLRDGIAGSRSRA